MKKIFFILLLAGLSGCFGGGPSIVTTGLEGKPMPSFSLLLMDSTTKLNTKDIPAGEPVVLFYFSPYCPFCRTQTEDIINQAKSFSNLHLYMLSNFPFPAIKDFYNHYQIKNYPNIIMGMDYDSYFGNYFKTPGVPYVAIYGRDKKLNQVVIGKTSANVIKDIALK